MSLVVPLLLLQTTAAALGDVLPDGPHIYVEGSAKIDVEPDRLEVTVQIGSLNVDVGEAKAEVDLRSARLIESCRSVGIDPDDLSSTSLSIRPSYRYAAEERVFEGTRVARSIEINLRDLSKYSQVIRAIIESDVAEVTSIQLFASSSANAEDQALQAAFADARQRAQRLASAAGGKLGDVFSISEFRTRTDAWELQSNRYTTTGPRIRADGAGYSLSAGATNEIFAPGLLRAYAEAYVVFKLKP